MIERMYLVVVFFAASRNAFSSFAVGFVVITSIVTLFIVRFDALFYKILVNAPWKSASAAILRLFK